MITYKVGDLIEESKDYEIIVHGCNCFCKMGAGFAALIRKEFPEAYVIDCLTKIGDKEKLGTITYTQKTKPIIINAYTQYFYGRKGLYVDYEAVRQCMKRIKLQFAGQRIAMPKIGCGLAGGDWETVERIIEEELSNEDVTIVTLQE